MTHIDLIKIIGGLMIRQDKLNLAAIYSDTLDELTGSLERPNQPQRFLFHCH